MKPDASFYFRDALGCIEFRKDRYNARGEEKKRFVWSWRVAAGANSGNETQWYTGRGKVRPSLYQRERIEERRKRFPLEIVFLVEGEKKVDRLSQEGLSATSPLDGSKSKLLEEDTDFLKGAVIVALPDNDVPGHEFADRAVEHLRPKTEVALRVDLPGLREGEDICEWLDVYGRSVDELYALIYPPLARAVRERVRVSDGAEILDEVSRYVRRHVVLSEAQADAVALWAVNTHVFDGSDFVPYLGITSAEKRSGKSRLLDVLSHLVARPWRYDNASDAVFFRKIGTERSTVLFDEADSLFKKAEDRPETVGAWNAGFHRKGIVSRCEGKKFELRDFSVFSPKAFAGIGEPPDTLRDRAIPIRLLRKTSGDEVERFRQRTAEIEAGALRARVEGWTEKIREPLTEAIHARPTMPPGLTDRAEDILEPLFAIADLAGGAWPERGRRSLVEVMTGAAAEDNSVGVRLLRDIRAVFDERDAIALRSEELTTALNAIEESGYASWNKGRGMTPANLAGKLRPFGIEPKPLRFGMDEQRRGYRLADFEDAFDRFCRVIRHGTEEALPF
jgi:hypothetical protein